MASALDVALAFLGGCINLFRQEPLIYFVAVAIIIAVAGMIRAFVIK